jgi:FkbM family methyltransferase
MSYLMKLRSIPLFLGRKPKHIHEYGFNIVGFDLPEYGKIEYAQWLHPSEETKIITGESVTELRKYIRPGDVAIDIGAHTGDTTIPIALAAGSDGCVLALEPNRYVFRILQYNSQLNKGKANIIPLMFAATPEDGEFDFEYSDDGFCNGGLHEGISRWRHKHYFKLKVVGKNLEKYLRSEYPMLIDRIGYIKIDAEGYDLTILRTLRRIIETSHPHIRTEVYQHLNLKRRQDLLSELHQHRYTVYKINDDADYCGMEVTEANLMDWQHYDVFAVPMDQD